MSENACEYKGQIISKRLLLSSDSSKIRTNEFGFFFCLTVLKTNLFVRFLEESEDTKKSFRSYLTFRSALKRTPMQDFYSFSIIFYYIISTGTYQKIGDLFCPVHFKAKKQNFLYFNAYHCRWQFVDTIFFCSFGDLKTHSHLHLHRYFSKLYIGFEVNKRNNASIVSMLKKLQGYLVSHDH